MLMVVETLLFKKQWPLYWTEEERGAFARYIATHPGAGDVDSRIRRNTQAALGASWHRQVWRCEGLLIQSCCQGEMVLLTLYAKSTPDKLTGQKLKEIRDALEK